MKKIVKNTFFNSNVKGKYLLVEEKTNLLYIDGFMTYDEAYAALININMKMLKSLSIPEVHAILWPE